MPTTTNPQLPRFAEAQADLDQRTEELLPDLERMLDRAFAEAANQAASALTAAAAWQRPDGDEVYDSKALEDEINRLLGDAKDELDASIRLKLGAHAPAGSYDTQGIASRIAGWHRQQVAEALLMGWNDGISVDDMADVLRSIGQSSALLVARTSMNGMNNSTSLAGAHFAGIEQKQWLATNDDRTRDSHEEIDGETIPLTGVFSNDCRFPGDPNGPPEEVWNCRCTLVYPEVVARMAEGLTEMGNPVGSDVEGLVDEMTEIVDEAQVVYAGPDVELQYTGMDRYLGVYHSDRRRISLRAGMDEASTLGTLAHEYGHYLDYQLMGQSPGLSFMETITPATKEFFEAVAQSSAFKDYKTRLTAYADDAGRVRYYKYLMQRNEAWARAYEQWLAEKTQDPRLLADIEKNIGKTQWSWRDWKAHHIGAKVEAILEQEGLL